MFNNKFVQVLSFIIVGLFISCDSNLSSQVKYSFKEGSKAGLVAQSGDIQITEKELLQGIESEIFEKEMEIFQLKFGKLQSLLIEKIINKDPKKAGMTNEQYIEKYISKVSSPTEREIDLFLKEMKVPNNFITPEYKERVKAHLTMKKQQFALDKWLAKQTDKAGVDVFFAKPQRPVFDVVVGNAPTYGNKDAKVTIIEYSDFQCPHCSKGAEIIEQIKKKYENKVRIAFKHFPLPFHPMAKIASEASLCANEQGVDYFWKMHDLLFADQNKFAVSELKATAGQIGLDLKKFEVCLDGHKFAQAVASDIEEGQKIGVRATPTFFINGKLMAGAGSLEAFQELIEQDL